MLFITPLLEASKVPKFFLPSLCSFDAQLDQNASGSITAKQFCPETSCWWPTLRIAHHHDLVGLERILVHHPWVESLTMEKQLAPTWPFGCTTKSVDAEERETRAKQGYPRNDPLLHLRNTSSTGPGSPYESLSSAALRAAAPKSH